MTKVAVVLAGCGFQDGAEIRESVIALLALDRQGAEVTVFAPDMEQTRVVNHLTGDEVDETRNVLVESARIARGEIQPLAQAKAADFDALVLPGGFGVALNLSDLAVKGAEATVQADYKRLITEFLEQQKPVGAICIAPAVLAAAVGKNYAPTVTIGDDAGTAGVIEACGGVHTVCATKDVVVDATHRVVSCSAYMRGDASIAEVADGD